MSKMFYFKQFCLAYKTSSIQRIQFSRSTQFNSIWPIDRTQSGVNTQGKNEPGTDGNEEVLCISQCSSITGTSPSDCLSSYPGLSLMGWLTYPTAEVQSMYSTAPADWAITECNWRPAWVNWLRNKINQRWLTKISTNQSVNEISFNVGWTLKKSFCFVTNIIVFVL